MPKRRVKERRKTAREFKRLVQVHGGKRKASQVEGSVRARLEWPPERSER